MRLIKYAEIQKRVLSGRLLGKKKTVEKVNWEYIEIAIQYLIRFRSIYEWILTINLKVKLLDQFKINVLQNKRVML